MRGKITKKETLTASQVEEFSKLSDVILENIPNMLIHCDLKLNVISSNCNWLRYIGLEDDSNMGSYWNKYIHDKDRPLLMEIIDKIDNPSLYSRSEIRIKGYKDIYKLFLCHVKAIDDHDELLISFTEIPHSYKLETTSKLELYNSQIDELSPNPVIVIDNQYNIVSISSKFRQTGGFSMEQLVGKKIDLFFNHNRPVKNEQGEKQLIFTHKPWKGIIQCSITKQCHEEVNIQINPIINDENSIEGYYIIFEDFNRNKELLDELKQYELFHELLILISDEINRFPIPESSTVINSLLELIGKWVDADRVYIFEHNFNKQTSSNTYEWCNNNISAEINNLQNVPIHLLTEWIKTHNEGKYVYIPDVSALPDGVMKETLSNQEIKSLVTVPLIRDSKNIGFVGFDSVRVLRKYKNFEILSLSLFSKFVVSLKNKVNHEVKLIEAKEKAEESNKLINAFLSNLSHEIRTPLNSIIGFSQILQESDVPEGKRRLFFKLIIEQAYHLLDMLNDIIEVAKFDSQIESQSRQTVIINDILENFKTKYDEKARAKNITIKLDCPVKREKGLIYTYKDRFVRIINYLFNNALKFTEKGTITLGYKILAESYEFFVKDTGIGIDKANHEIIFQPFRQLELELTKRYDGNGVGLALVKKIVDQLDGEIWVDSELGKGSTFFFTIPFKEKKELSQ